MTVRSETIIDTLMWIYVVLLLYIYIILVLWYLPLSGSCQGTRALDITNNNSYTPSDNLPMFVFLTLYNIDD